MLHLPGSLQVFVCRLRRREKGGSEDTSRSVKGRQPLATPHLPDFAPAYAVSSRVVASLCLPPSAAGKRRKRGHLALRQGAAAPCNPASSRFCTSVCCIFQGRCKSLFAAFGGGKKEEARTPRAPSRGGSPLQPRIF